MTIFEQGKVLSAPQPQPQPQQPAAAPARRWAPPAEGEDEPAAEPSLADLGQAEESLTLPQDSDCDVFADADQPGFVYPR